jgi:hypothetical protein
MMIDTLEFIRLSCTVYVVTVIVIHHDSVVQDSLKISNQMKGVGMVGGMA